MPGMQNNMCAHGILTVLILKCFKKPHLAERVHAPARET